MEYKKKRYEVAIFCPFAKEECKSKECAIWLDNICLVTKFLICNSEKSKLSPVISLAPD